MSGCAGQLLQLLGTAGRLPALEKVVPLMDQAESGKMLRLVQGIPVPWWSGGWEVGGLGGCEVGEKFDVCFSFGYVNVFP